MSITKKIMSLIILIIVLIVFSTVGVIVVSQTSSHDKTSLKLRGVNLAGAEFAGHLDYNKSRGWGRHGIEYIYPVPLYVNNYNDPEKFLELGVSVFRLPFLWQRLQPDLTAPFNITEVERLHNSVTYLTSLGAKVVLDPHNYARYGKTEIGRGDVKIKNFASFWRQLSALFKDNQNVIFGLINEPYGISPETWVITANAAIKQIRKEGARQLILVPGTRWSGAHSWSNTDSDGMSNAIALKHIVDPINHIAFEAHQYFDDNSGGDDPNCVAPEQAIKNLKPFTLWLREYKQKGFIGEFGTGSNNNCLKVLEAVLSYLEANGDVYIGWTYWAAGPWWPDETFFLIKPDTDSNAQMKVLSRYLKMNKYLKK